MPLSFPSAPNLNDTYTSGSVTWVWNGYAWDVVPEEDPTFDDVYATTFHGVLDGNANTATALFSTRTINGVNFNGTANVQVPGSRVSDIPPANPTVGDVWYNTENGLSYVYYDSFWIEI